MPIVTISGNTGSGATEIGRLVARSLGFDYVDREILTEAAHALGVSERAIAGRDDRSPPPHLRERLASFLQDFLERSAIAGAADPLMATGGLETLMASTYREAAALPAGGREELTDSRYKEAITTIMNGLAEKGDVVIVGRGSQAILCDRPNTLHVGVTAPFAVRVQRVAEREGIPAEKAKSVVEESDRGRLDFHSKYFKVNPTDPNLYDIVINSASMSFEAAAQLVVAALSAKISPFGDSQRMVNG
jgi:cytidylate kinase